MLDETIITQAIIESYMKELVNNLNVDVIIAENVPTEGLGLAVMNRLRKASDYNIIKAE